MVFEVDYNKAALLAHAGKDREAADAYRSLYLRMQARNEKKGLKGQDMLLWAYCLRGYASFFTTGPLLLNEEDWEFCKGVLR